MLDVTANEWRGLGIGLGNHCTVYEWVVANFGVESVGKMRSIDTLLILFFVAVQKSQSIQLCPSSSENPRCLDETRLNCNNSLFAPTDFHCCDGLKCVSVTIPATDTQERYETTMCVASSSNRRRVRSSVAPAKTPPVMASAWSAATTYYNMSNGDTGWGHFWFDESHRAIRTDFYPTCPFLQLYAAGIDANYVPCTVLFYEGQNYYVYPSARVCCNYTFPAWHPEWLCQSNATYNGNVLVNGQMTDFWMVEWFSNFTGVGPIRNLRNMYTVADSRIPVRFREDLDTGYLDFHDYVEGPIDPTIFTSVIDAYGPCHPGHGDAGSTDRTCTHYNSQTLRRSWPCDNPTCS
ncbi:unnamed protein product [Rotaria sp. Silwood2]|nr:unnamed protein product [Rotaria sp. Silwood2]CAF4394858.1 unnamed protein product [Rotaria sp. Silwood2]